MHVDSDSSSKNSMSLKKKNYAAILVVFVIISGLFLIGTTGFRILSGMRAYVGAEGLWAKSQYEATYHLIQYVYTGKDTMYNSFVSSLQVPLGYKVARLELEKPKPTDKIIIKGFRDGESHPSDIPKMIFLYKHFKNMNHVAKAIEQWEIADSLITELLLLGEKANHKIVNNSMSRAENVQTLASINLLQEQLRKAEKMFSDNMSLAARWTANRLFAIMFIFTLIGSILCFIVLRMTIHMMHELHDQKTQYKNQVKHEIVLKNELQKSEKYLDNIINNIGDPVFVKDEECRLILVNDAFCTLFELERDNIIGKTLANKVPTDEMESFVSIDKHVLKTGQENMNEESLTLSGKQTKTIYTRKTRFVDNNDNKYLIGVIRDVSEHKKTAEQRDKLINELQKTLAEVKTLRGCLPICSNCKNIRDDKGYWNQIESYIQKHSETEFTHSICPDCAKELYPSMNI